MRDINNNDRMGERKDHFAQHTRTIGETWRFTLRLSDLSGITPGKSGVTLRGEAEYLSHLYEALALREALTHGFLLA